MERYDVGQRVSNIFNINTRADAFWRQAATLELERAVIYSFTKRGFTIIDPHAVGKSFCTHVRREREQFGRECPAQWSWIGGLTGPTNDSWHLEMRDFVVTPKYEYAVTGEALYSSLDGFVDHSSEDSEIAWHEPERKAPRVLILYGSETGHAESLARTLRCLLGALKPTLMTLNEAAGLDAVLVQGFSHVLCLVSTFGDGDAPSNARAFFKKELPSLSSVHSPVYFSVLALGSTLYPHFCKAGVDLDRKLEVAGLIRLTEGVDKADALEGSEDTIKNWICRVKTSILPPSIEHAITTKSHQKGPCQRSTTILKWRLQLGPKYMVVAEQERAQSLCISNRVRGGKWMSSKRIRPKKKVGGNEKSQSLGSMLAIGHVSHTNARSIRRITFKVPPGQTYETGDHISVQPMNSGASVERFLGCFRDELQRQARISCPSADIDLLQWQAEQIFDLEIKEGGIRRPADVVFRTPTTLETLLSRVLEFGMNMTVAKDLLRLCIDVCQQEQSNREEMSEFLSAMVPVLMGNSDPERFIARFPTVTHFFECFGFLLSTTDGVPPLVTLGEVLVRLPRLQPRFYSISSSSKASPKDLSITVGVLNCETSQKVKFDGVCSNFLAGLRSGRDTAQISIRKSTFRLPQVLDCPIVMVSTGTGISPMVGFLHDLVIAKSNGVTIGEVHLFFGCRTEDEFLYREEIEHCVASGLVTLHLAVSRSEYQPKEYVQDLIRKMGSAFSELLMQPDTAYYVCGSARVAAECREAAIDGLREHEGLRDTQAVHHIEQMSLDNRWQSDIWGALLGNEQARSSALLPLVLPPLVLPPSIPQSIRAQVRKSIY
jgi:sulfite reductase alpha subunit-like flavoprotein